MAVEPSITRVTGDRQTDINSGDTTSFPVLEWSGDGLPAGYLLKVVFKENGFSYGQPLLPNPDSGDKWITDTVLFHPGTYECFLVEPASPLDPVSEVFTLTFTPQYPSAINA